MRPQGAGLQAPGPLDPEGLTSPEGRGPRPQFHCKTWSCGFHGEDQDQEGEVLGPLKPPRGGVSGTRRKVAPPRRAGPQVPGEGSKKAGPHTPLDSPVSQGVFTLLDARSFSGLTSKISPLGSMLNFDADVKKTTARLQCENRVRRKYWKFASNPPRLPVGPVFQ